MKLIDYIITAFEQNGNKWMTPRDLVRALEDDGVYVSEISIKRRVNEKIDYTGDGEKPDLFEFQEGKYRKYRLKIHHQSGFARIVGNQLAFL